MSDPKANQNTESSMLKELVQTESDLGDFFNDFFRERWPKSWLRTFQWDEPAWAELGPMLVKLPRVEVITQEDELIIRANLDGIQKDELEISVDDKTVTLRGRTVRHSEYGSNNYYRTKTSRGEFSRTIDLPEAVDPEKAWARMDDDGWLELHLPRPYRPKRKMIRIRE